MALTVLSTLVIFIFLINYGDSIMCHRCFSSMGGCGDDVVWRMYPWQDCGDGFCVKVIEKLPGEEPRYIRECEKNLLKSTRHRLRMPVLRRHGYCVPARVNNPFNPLDSVDSRITYCFCNDWNGCNSATSHRISGLLAMVVGSCTLYLVSKLF